MHNNAYIVRHLGNVVETQIRHFIVLLCRSSSYTKADIHLNIVEYNIALDTTSSTAQKLMRLTISKTNTKLNRHIFNKSNDGEVFHAKLKVRLAEPSSTKRANVVRMCGC